MHKRNQNETDAKIYTAYTGKSAKNYDQHRFTTKQGMLFDTLEKTILDKTIKLINKKVTNILEVGCGTGRFSHYLAEQGFNVTATDPSKDMLEQARSKYNKNFRYKIAYYLSEGANLPFDSLSFDFVLTIRVLNQTESKQYALRMVKEMIRVTSESGYLLCEFTNENRPLARHTRSVRLSFSELRKLMENEGCEVVREWGVLVFSQTILNIVPSVFVPLWGILEKIAALILWRKASRGYILAKKMKNAT